MLITRPNHDITTNYLYYWSIVLIEYAKEIGQSVVDLKGKRANEKEFVSVIKKVKPNFVVLNGHGNEETVTGYDNKPLVNLDNADILKEKIIYARSCQSAKKLGVKSVEAGCKSYIGYNEDFVFVTDEHRLTRPLDDKTAQLFLEPSNKVVTYLLKGHSSSTANQKSKELYKKTIQKFMLSSALKEEKELIPYLAWDYNHQVCLGNQNAKL
ncbi:conserved hypothetical protein [Candidatus Roizmanbacteria bacterium]|nr:conserved hypothetical protein [Candidatus Roizmanbacteria bacterium]